MADLGLFAGLDSTGVIRFVADVPRGSACGCFCSACGSPLVAKRGDVKIWHFAHEASQERPECLIGAANLLRRLAIEHLQAAQYIELPPYTAYVQAGTYPRTIQKQVTGTPRFQAISDWAHDPPQRARVAKIVTDSDVEVTLYVDVATRPNAFDNEAPSGIGALHFLIPLPSQGQLKALSDALKHIASAGYLRWIYLPDVTGEIEAAQAQAEKEAAGLEREYEQQRIREEKVRAEILGLRRFSAQVPDVVGIVPRPMRLQNPC